MLLMPGPINMRTDSLRSILAVLLSLGASFGCASAMEQPLVARRFQELHGCAASDIHSNGDRWIARGCGVEAHYVCVDKYADKHSFVWGGDTCVEEHSEPTIKPSDSSDESDAAPVEREGKLQ